MTRIARLVSAETQTSRTLQMASLCCSSLAAATIIKDEKKVESKSEKTKPQIQYGVEDVPAPHLCLLFGLQQLFLSISSTITVPLVVSVNICIGDLYVEKAKLMSTFLFMCGVCTILQCLIGVRLPILQGGCHKFLPAIAALMSLETWKCPDMSPYTAANSTLDPGEVWKPRIREIQGGIMVASLFQILVGSTGLLGVLLQYIGPITVVPTVSLVGFSLIEVAQKFCQAHWGISAFTVGLLFLFSLYLTNVNVPFPAYSRQDGCHIIRYPLFKLMPVILAVVIAWGLCALLTVFDVAPASLRTDAKSVVLESADWFFFPYPGQWGVPTVSVAGVIAMLAVTISSVIESVGVFYACARTCEVPPPPAHAVNRGIAVEGIGSLFSGAVGSGGATTSYSQNVGAIGFTRVASRSAFYVAGAVFLLGGIVGKVGAFLTTVPDPVLGGIVLVSFGMVTSVGLAALSFIDMSSARNMTIIGTSLLVGLMIPRFIEQHPTAINTGIPDLDRVIAVVLGTSMFVGGVMAFLLDNTVPGTIEERGIEKWRCETEFETEINEEDVDTGNQSQQDDDKKQESEAENATKIPNGSNNETKPTHIDIPTDEAILAQGSRKRNGDIQKMTPSQETKQNKRSIYDIPLITPYLEKLPFTRYMPFLPNFAFSQFSFSCKKCKGCRRNKWKPSPIVLTSSAGVGDQFSS
ncbi:unnamed protein product [Candidula unifasciata]|uniref:Solute carrier family 23 member 2 n=1 Tax=Candidula unifasciata TaxID=100452 RepID=A0A8S3YSI6_9EUPU|nr:unnamed protein product [Candidula unifasciata]